MTTAINILATFRLVFNWLSRLRLAEFMVVTPPLLGSFSLLRLTNLMVVLQVLKEKKGKKKTSNGYDILLLFPPSHVLRKKGAIIYVPNYGGWFEQESYGGRFLFFSFLAQALSRASIYLIFFDCSYC